MATKNIWDWNELEEQAKRHEQGSSTWLKLADDGDKAVVVFLGNVYGREVAFVDGKYEEYTDELRAKGVKAQTRVASNVALYDGKEVKVLEQSMVFYKTLLQIRAKRPLTEWAFEITRHGAARDKNTTYTILPEHKLTPEEQAEFEALPLHDLERLYSGEGDDGGGLGSYDRKSDGAVDPKTAQAIVQSLKALPREAVDRFCKQLGISRIKDLPAAKIDKARALVEALEAEFNGKDDGGDIDPFAS
ncbi:MAG: hypothetical protein KC583_08175 [Myxococcales bacterium]|nr:hypothetical protein [Myxococcales bacterium]